MKPTLRILSAVAVVTASLGFLFGGTAAAHDAEDSYVYLDIAESAISGRVDYPFGDLREVLGFELRGSEDEIIAELEGRADELRAYADEHLAIGAGGVDFPLTFGALDYLFEDNPEREINYVIIEYSASVPGDVPRVLEVTFDPFFDEVEDRNALVLIQNDWAGGVFDNGEAQIEDAVYTFDAGSRSQTLDLGDASRWKNFTASLWLGLDHIRTGPDHILFILVLLLPSVLVFSGDWKPSDNFGRSLWRIIKIATMFTIAHSITFSLAGLGILPLPSAKITETVIALSIAAAALHNLRPLFPNREWTIAFGFGLFHGMGFASLVSGLEVSRGTQLISLLGRNVGIEIGQILVILSTFGLLYLLRNTLAYRWVLTAGSAVLSLVALLWMFERIFETDFGTNGFVERFVRFPRALYAVAVLTALAAVYQLYERRNDRLVDTVDIPTVEGGRLEPEPVEV